MSAGRGVDRVDFVFSGTGRACEVALAWLHGLLVRVAARELRRRQVLAGIDGPELDDLARPTVPAPVLVAADPDGDHRAPGEWPRTEDILRCAS
jgi:hypothetical protein